MNIDIKFRGKQKTWIYGGFHKGPDGRCVILKGYSSYEVKPESVGMCTGIKDLKGKDIYYGDILRGIETFENSKEYPLMVIQWNEKTAAFEPKQINGGKYSCPMSWAQEAVIIGNTYDNPTLVKNGKKKS